MKKSALEIKSYRDNRQTPNRVIPVFVRLIPRKPTESSNESLLSLSCSHLRNRLKKNRSLQTHSADTDPFQNPPHIRIIKSLDTKLSHLVYSITSAENRSRLNCSSRSSSRLYNNCSRCSWAWHPSRGESARYTTLCTPYIPVRLRFRLFHRCSRNPSILQQLCRHITRATCTKPAAEKKGEGLRKTERRERKRVLVHLWCGAVADSRANDDDDRPVR